MSTTRRKFLQFIGLEGFSIVTMGKTEIPMKASDTSVYFVRNEALPTILEGYKGNPMIDGRFVNTNLSVSGAPFSSILKWFTSPNPQKEEKDNEKYSIPIHKISDLNSIKEDCVIWLGHASFLFRLGGKWLLTDPCLTSPAFQKRFTPLPIPISELFVDYLLISHGHYDHLDSTTISELPSKNMTALVPLKMGDLIRSMNKNIQVYEAGWYQEFPLLNEAFRIYFLPAQHWYLRVPWDRNKILWGSFMIEYKGKCFYFAGDTAYADHFSAITELFPSIDYCFMPIGAYKPEYVMKTNHTNPEEAVRGFHDLHGKTFLPMHYGTFDLADEPRGEPIRLLKSLESDGTISGTLKTPEIGQVILI
ncbi:MBL fold metallo-hydrolase [bacterium]|nr:MBL fold metallo-hydrolase [bacterium]